MTDAMAVLTSAIGAIERKQPRREFLHHSAVNGTGKVFGIKAFPIDALRKLLIFLWNDFDQSQAITTLQGRAQRIGETFLDSFPSH
jgi:hypothetical protein